MTKVSAALDVRRILVVPDDRDDGESLGMLLRFLNAEVHVDHNGTDAMGRASTCLPSVVLLDLRMPHMDGFEVAKRLRAKPEMAGVKLIALTGWGQEGD